MRSVATDVARNEVCVSVCVLDTRVSCVRTAEPINMPFRGADSCGSKEPCVRCGQDHSSGRGTFEGGHVSPHYNVSMRECIANRSSRGGNTAMRPFAKLL